MLFNTISIKDIIVYKLIMISFLFIVKSSFGIEQYTAHGGPVKGLAVSTNNQLMASASFDYSVVVLYLLGSARPRGGLASPQWFNGD